MSSAVAVLKPASILQFPAAAASVCLDESFDHLWHYQCVVSARSLAHLGKNCSEASTGVQNRKLSPDAFPRSPLPLPPSSSSCKDHAALSPLIRPRHCNDFAGSDQSPSSTEPSPRASSSEIAPAFFEADPGSPAVVWPAPVPSYSKNNTDAPAVTVSEIFPDQEYARRCIPQAERQELQGVFHTFDENRDGKISIEELGRSFERLGIPKTEHAIVSLLKTTSLRVEGYVDEDEFVLLYNSACNCIDNFDNEDNVDDMDQDFREAFQLFDKDRDGFITPAELQSVLCCLGFPQAQELDACVKMISRVDENGDGQVDFFEFKKIFTVKDQQITSTC